MYRPIDVIFRHPVKKFTVIYQNGVLWQLPKLTFDSQSLQYKKRYRGSRKEIFVASNQQHDTTDPILAEQLLTINLPTSIVGRDVDEFDHWWRYNWFKYSDLVAQKIIQQKNAPQSPLNQKINPNKTVATPDVVPITSQDIIKPKVDIKANTPTTNTSGAANYESTLTHSSNAHIDDMLDHMLEDLLNS